MKSEDFEPSFGKKGEPHFSRIEPARERRNNTLDELRGKLGE
jgi:hypothetical protein